MALQRACKRSEIQPGNVKFASVGGKDLVISNVNGTFYAMDNWCTHEQGNLSEGTLSTETLTCPEHGAQFDVRTGKVLVGPNGEAPETISPEKTYKVSIQGDDVMVDIP